MKITVDDLTGPEIAEFLTEHLRQMQAMSPPGSNHALDLDGLRAPGVVFWSVREGDDAEGADGRGREGGEAGEAGEAGARVVACGALKRLDAEHGELKSMRTSTARRRSGIASQLLGHIIGEAERMGLTRLSLETGSDEFFRPARRLYEKFGFTYCEPFADYRPDPYSAFMTRVL
ncbi:GNAT family N-acetyltransferase [Phaeacidiphilus oryzae]|uniref:GNAT family N-acetyltransferase n=1 Tax=Phaeacidiphilus oryzae TaxID=348818 RepID=UPI00055FFBF8|nr:GNAT family N-acetyltransferase [Phaeacidiphilus oryzae]